jgi:hypothetical protein
VRWATVMANVFMMMKAPTTRAITAKMSRNLLKNDRPCWNWFCVSLMIFAPVTASVPGGSTRCRLLTSCCCDTPGAATKPIELNVPGAVTSRCATGVVNSTTDAPPGLSAVPKTAIPAMRTRSGGPLASTVVVSPTARWPVVALCLSITTSSGACGACPATSWNGLRAGTALQLPPRVGAPLPGLPIGVPSLPISRVYPKALPSAAATPGTCLSAGSSDASIFGRSPLPMLVKTALARTTASVPLYTLADRSLKILLMVSVSISVPAVKATPMITARAVVTSRRFRASRLWKTILTIVAHSPKRLIRSSTRSAVGWCIWSTIRPSARNTMRSA